MYRIKSGASAVLDDTGAFIDQLNTRPDFFPGAEIVLARAPGRIDLMGGIADYSGSLVLQMPTAAATHAAVQLQTDPILRIVSLQDHLGSERRFFEMSLADFRRIDGPVDYTAARALFEPGSEDHWAAYVAGAFLELMRERHIAFEHGAHILISSAVPEGKGVSSSAALEVAAMQAIIGAYKIHISPREIAFLCQRVENLVAGAPCGVMDQMTAACGEADRLLCLLCQPGELKASVRLPDELAVWGIDSGIRHSVGGSEYETVRTAAFMGYRMIAHRLGLPCVESGVPGLVHISDDSWHGYLANIDRDEFEQKFAMHLPERMLGEEFLKTYSGITDAVTTVRPDRTYPVLSATRHPINEHARVTLFARILDNWRDLTQAVTLGELMYQSHESYSSCGLGSTGTDLLVHLVREMGSKRGLYGAKITGGGSGGTVAVLGHRSAKPSIEDIVENYARQTGHNPIVMSGTSPGAAVFGNLILERES
jgi:galactokinase